MNISDQVDLAAWTHERRVPKGMPGAGRWIRGGPGIFRVAGFEPGVAKPEVGDKVVGEGPGDLPGLLLGHVVARVGLVAAVDADDGHRYQFDWTSGKVVGDRVPLSRAMPAEQLRQAGQHEAALRERQHNFRRQANATWTVDEKGSIVHHAHAPQSLVDRVSRFRAKIRAQAGADVSPPPHHAPGVSAGVRALRQAREREKAAIISVERDPHPPNPLAPWLVKAADLSEWHVDDREAGRLHKMLREREGLHYTAPGTEIAPGVKQYMLPGTEKLQPTTEYGQNSPPVKELRSVITLGELERAKMLPEDQPEQGIQGVTRILTLPDYGEGVRKVVVKDQAPERNDREELSYYVSQALGGGSGLPTVVRYPGNPGRIVEDVVPGRPAARYAMDAVTPGGDWGPNYDEQSVLDEIAYSPTGQEIGLLDYLTGNYDRHDYNYLIDEQGVPHPIDMGMAQFDGGTDSPFWEGEEGQVPAEVVDEWAAELAKIEPEFRRLGHEDWYVVMMDALSRLAESSEYSIGAQLGVIELTRSPAWLHELRIPKGRPHAGEWVHSPSDVPGKGLDRYKMPPHSRLLNPRADVEDPADYPFFKKHPVSVQNVLDAYDAVPEQTRKEGMKWYSDAHLLARAIGMLGGGHGDDRQNAELGAILLGNYSSSANWPINMFRAARASDENKPIAKGDGYVSQDQVKKAQKALDGMSIDDVLISPKTRSFAHLLATGDDSPDDPYGHVVIDAHALNVAMGGGERGLTYVRGKKQQELPPEDTPPLDDARAHEYVGDMYREAARIISKRDGQLITPYQVQAVTWVQQVLANMALDKAEMEGAEGGVLGRAKGRLSAKAKDWQRWLAYAKAHNLQLVPGVSALAHEAMMAQLIELIGEDAIYSQVIELDFNPGQPRGPDGKWIKIGGLTALDPFYNELPESGHRGTVRVKGTLGPGGLGREREDAERLAAYREQQYQATKVQRQRQHAYPEIGPENARGNSRPVSPEEFQHLASLGNQWIDQAKDHRAPIIGLEGPEWDAVKARSYGEVTKSWGGATIDTDTGKPLAHDADVYAISVKPRGMYTVSVPESATAEEFGRAMDRAKELFRPALERRGFYLGVFHDDDEGRIDIDPVAIVDSIPLVEQVGAYTRAIGGAYHFKSGDGFWPPHVEQGASMADDDTHFEHGYAQWHTQAVAVQEPEPDEPGIAEQLGEIGQM